MNVFEASVSGGNTVEKSISTPTATTSFIDWVRYPAEHDSPGWIYASDAVAYTRDASVGAESYIYNAQNGDSWYFTAQDGPGGGVYTGSTVSFFDEYMGYRDAFVCKDCGWIIYNTRNFFLIGYVNTCQDGFWLWKLYNNGEQYYLGDDLYLYPQVPPDAVDADDDCMWNQGAYGQPYANVCRPAGCTTSNCDVPCGSAPDLHPVTISQEGCALTVACDLLGYHGVKVDPLTLNTWLIANSGYDDYGKLYWSAIQRYAKSRGLELNYLPGDETPIEEMVCTFGPQPLGTKLSPTSGRPRHRVLLTGRDKEKTTWLINDPDGGIKTTLERYGNTTPQPEHLRRFMGKERIVSIQGTCEIRYHSPGYIRVVDQNGLAVSPTENTLPNSAYFEELVSDLDAPDVDGPLVKEIVLQNMAGKYQLAVNSDGESGFYDLEISSTDSNEDITHFLVKDVEISAGEVHNYNLDYTEGTDLVGTFDGGGQKPTSTNKILTYGNIAGSTTELPVGASVFKSMVIYSPTILPTTFTATLNGANITQLFNPSPNHAEVVEMEMGIGRNTLILEADGINTAQKTEHDKDRLVIIRTEPI